MLLYDSGNLSFSVFCVCREIHYFSPAAKPHVPDVLYFPLLAGVLPFFVEQYSTVDNAVPDNEIVAGVEKVTCAKLCERIRYTDSEGTHKVVPSMGCR